MNKKVRAELMFVFSQLHTHHLKLVPQEIINEAKSDFDEEVFFNLDRSKPFTEQDLSEETFEILHDVFSKYADIDFED